MQIPQDIIPKITRARSEVLRSEQCFPLQEGLGIDHARSSYPTVSAHLSKPWSTVKPQLVKLVWNASSTFQTYNLPQLGKLDRKEDILKVYVLNLVAEKPAAF